MNVSASLAQCLQRLDLHVYSHVPFYQIPVDVMAAVLSWVRIIIAVDTVDPK